MRKSIATIGALAILAALTACASGPSASECLPSGDASSAVKATGSFEAASTVSFPTPLFVTKTQKSELKVGKGAQIEPGQPVLINWTVLNARTNGVITSGLQLQTAGLPADIQKKSQTTIPAISDALSCATVGSRIAVVGSAKDTHGGQASSDGSFGAKDSLVFVIDIEKAFLARANGSNQIPPSGMPTVVLATDGTPGITIPDTAAPTAFDESVLKAGSGAKVTNGSSVVVQYTTVGWTDKAVGNSTWASGDPTVVKVGDSSIPTGLSKGLAGQRVGSQLLLVLPPKEAGTTGSPTTDTQVFVVDILGAVG